MVPDSIVMHHSLTKDGETVSWGAIRRYHVEEQGWADIGYQYGIELVGNYYEVLLGRMVNTPGAHCKENGMNSRSIGICMVGNFDVTLPPVPQYNKAVQLVCSLMDVFNIPASRVYGHNQFATYKSCPGKKFNMQAFREDVDRAMHNKVKHDWRWYSSR